MTDKYLLKSSRIFDSENRVLVPGMTILMSTKRRKESKWLCWMAFAP